MPDRPLPLADDPAAREEAATRLAAVLEATITGSRVTRRGSLARGDADAVSDLDLAWHVPAGELGIALGAVSAALASVAPLSSLRSDPEVRDDGTVLVFARFAGAPLARRLDLEIVPDRPPDGAVIAWDPLESALMNALGAARALVRSRHEEARGLVERGLERAGITCGLTVEHDVRRAAALLAEGVAARRPGLAAEADAIVAALAPSAPLAD